MNAVAAFLDFIATSVLLGLMLGFQHGSLDPWVAMLSLGGGAIAGGIGWWRSHPQSLPSSPRGWAWIPVVLFTLFSLRAFLWLVFREGDELRVLSPNNLGDMSLHLTFIQYLANGAPLWPDSPIFASAKLSYPAGMDFFNSLLALVGVDIVRGLIWTGLLGALATGVALLRWGGPFTMLGFLCNGGLIGFACFLRGADEPFFQDYQSDWAWKNFPLALFVTQRGFLFALPAGLLLLRSWRTRFFEEGRGWRLPIAGELLLYTAMPFFHVHTFLVLSFLLVAFFVARPPARRGIATLVGLAIVPATMLVCLATGTLAGGAARPASTPMEMLGWQPGWMVNDETTADAWERFADAHPATKPFAAHGRFLFFWFGNFGVLPLLLVPVVLTLLRTVQRREFPASAAWLSVAAVVVVTPFLGGWDAYQHEPLGALLSGGGRSASAWSVISAIIAIAAAAAGNLLRGAGITRSAARPLLFAAAGLFLVDSLLSALHFLLPQIPQLRANAIPLVIVTFALGLLLWRVARRPDADAWPAAIFFPSLFLFFACCNVKFAPWEWDNTKMMMWACLCVLPIAWDVLIVRWRSWARALACAALFFSGFVSLIGGINGQHQGHPIADRSTLDAVSESVRPIPVTETFAALPTYNHPLLLCGRKVVMGFEGHLGSHGIDYRSVGSELDALMNGAPGWRMHAARLGARYLFFGPRELERWPASRQPWRNEAPLVAGGDWGEIFDLAMPPRKSERDLPPVGAPGPPRFR